MVVDNYHYLIQKVLRKLVVDFFCFQKSVEICRHEIGDEITVKVLDRSRQVRQDYAYISSDGEMKMSFK